jgi:glycosyltransferase involved in cell wall biosynthesis
MGRDYGILSKHYDVEHVNFVGISSILKIITAVRASDISYSWFADVWAFFAVVASKIFRKKSIVVVGGYDVACEPQIDYGLCMKNKLRQWMGDFALNNADLLLPVSTFTKTECLKHLTHQRDLGVLYNGIDTEKFKPNGEKEEMVLTVGNKIKLKGIDTFAEVAWHHPNITFIVIGMPEDSQAELERYCDIPDNLILIGNVPYNDMAKYYQRAKVYCQLSYRESFGMALAEAMACGCIPVVTDRGAMAEVVGDAGVYVPFGDVDATVLGIEKAFASYNFHPRKQIEDNFSLSRRESALKNTIDYNLKDSRTRNRLQKSMKLANIQSGERVLDLGCNDSAIKTLFPDDVDYTGVDMNAGDVQGNLECGIPKELQNNTFDIIFLNEFIEHIENFRSLLIQCRGILSENGRIIISTPSPNRVMFGEDPTHIHCFRKSNMYNLASICGLQIDKIIGTYLGIPYIPIISLSQTFLTGVIIYKLTKRVEDA